MNCDILLRHGCLCDVVTPLTSPRSILDVLSKISHECFLLFLEGDPVSCGCPETPVEPEKKKKKKRRADEAEQEQSEDHLFSLIVYSIFPRPPFVLLPISSFTSYLTLAQSRIISRLVGHPCRNKQFPLCNAATAQPHPVGTRYLYDTSP